MWAAGQPPDGASGWSGVDTGADAGIASTQVSLKGADCGSGRGLATGDGVVACSGVTTGGFVGTVTMAAGARGFTVMGAGGLTGFAVMGAGGLTGFAVMGAGGLTGFAGTETAGTGTLTGLPSAPSGTAGRLSNSSAVRVRAGSARAVAKVVGPFGFGFVTGAGGEVLRVQVSGTVGTARRSTSFSIRIDVAAAVVDGSRGSEAAGRGGCWGCGTGSGTARGAPSK
jgi:hypothetical protein